MKPIDLRSDTVTRPDKEMLDFMMKAPVGDDVFGDDPTVLRLQEKAAEMFGMEASLFCPSGTMTNQIAVKVHTHPGEEIICDQGSHVYRYEGGGVAFNSGCSVRLINGDRGRIRADQVLENINPDNEHYPRTSLVVAENTCNKGGGSVYNPEALREIGETCRRKGLKFHLDGARLFNAMIASHTMPADYGQIFDSISICLSKGLGAPVGSLLLGSRPFIQEARRVRKVLGGGMRQAGYLAAAGLYALENNTDRLAEDHVRAAQIADFLIHLEFVESVIPPETNIIIFTLKEGIPEQDCLAQMERFGVLAVGFGSRMIRLVTHLDFTDQDMSSLNEALLKVNAHYNL